MQANCNFNSPEKDPDGRIAGTNPAAALASRTARMAAASTTANIAEGI